MTIVQSPLSSHMVSTRLLTSKHEARGRSRDNKVYIKKSDLFNHYPISCTGPAEYTKVTKGLCNSESLDSLIVRVK